MYFIEVHKEKVAFLDDLLQFRHQFMCAATSFIVSHCFAHKKCALGIFYFARWSESAHKLRASYFVFFFKNSIASSAATVADSTAKIAFGQCCLTNFTTFLKSIVPSSKPLCSSLFVRFNFP